MTGARAGEAAVIRLARDLSARARAEGGVRVGIGDDCAVLDASPGAALLATTDLLIEDVHFRRRWAEPADIGWKAVAVNVSDIAAMGGTPRWALVALACPPATTMEEIEAFYEGALAAAGVDGVAVVGGDTSSAPSGWMVNVTLLGEAVHRPLLRSTARVGDVVAVTGSLGRSGAGLALLEHGIAPPDVPAALLADLTAAHLRPRARAREGAWLAGAGGVTAMMDLSDGLATDLGRLVEASGVGARVAVDRLPIDDATRVVARSLETDPLAWATGGGEDYELLLTCEPDAVARLARGLEDATGARLVTVGEIVAGAGVRWTDARGREVTVTTGFEHFAGRPAGAPIRD